MKNAVFWIVRQRGSCNNRRFGGIYRLYHEGDKNLRTRNNVVTANVVPSSPILFTLMM
jgi:hypothetical protein